MDWKLAIKLAWPMVVDIVNKKASADPTVDKWDYAAKVMASFTEILHMAGLAAGEPDEYTLAALEIKAKLEAEAA